MEEAKPVAEPSGLAERAADYVRGALKPEDAAQVEADAEKDSALAAEIDFLRNVKSALRNAADVSGPGDIGWARLSCAISRERRIPGAPRFAALQAASAAACAVALWHFLALPLLPDGNDAPQHVAVSQITAIPSLRVTFSASATEGTIRALLLEVGGALADGPSAIGVYRLRFENEQTRDRALEILRSRREIIETVGEG